MPQPWVSPVGSGRLALCLCPAACRAALVIQASAYRRRSSLWRPNRGEFATVKADFENEIRKLRGPYAKCDWCPVKGMPGHYFDAGNLPCSDVRAAMHYGASIAARQPSAPQKYRAATRLLYPANRAEALQHANVRSGSQPIYRLCAYCPAFVGETVARSRRGWKGAGRCATKVMFT